MAKTLSRRNFLKFSTSAAALAVTANLPGLTRRALAASPFGGDEEIGPGVQWKLPTLSFGPEQLASERVFDYVVIGSGYGGSVTAARLAQKYSAEIQAGKISIAILERGKEWIPGTFPQTLKSGAAQLSRTRNTVLDDVIGGFVGKTIVNNPLGLYDFHFHEEVDVLVGQGLGGGSLINGNVVIEPDADLFDERLPNGTYRWPSAIREEMAGGQFSAYFDRVRGIIDPQQLPHGLGDTVPAKSKNLAAECDALGAKWGYLDIAVNFKPDGSPSPAGVPRNACRLCGDCITGCNWGAKQTLYMNYLPLARKAGAEIFTRVKASAILKRGDHDYQINILKTPDENQPSNHFPDVIYARNVIISAGTLGSTELLLRSSAPGMGGLAVSNVLGQRFSSNADSLGMSYDCDQTSDSLAFGTRTGPRAKIVAGTCMEMTEDGRYVSDGGANGGWKKRPLRERFLIQHGVFPSAIVDVLGKSTIFVRFDEGSISDFVEVKADGALNRSMVYLGMGHDDADGVASLDDTGEVKVKWPGLKDESALNAIRARFKDHCRVNHGKYSVPNPLQTFGGRLTTVHPIGGCVMGETRATGVVNDRGQVYDASAADPVATHAGLYVVDGSIIPDSLGVNPLLTISALSERVSDFMTGRRS